MPQTLYIIDGHAQIYRAYYAPFRPLSSAAGEPTRATYVFTQMLLNLIRDRRPDYLVMVLDADESLLERRNVYAEYKAQRQPAPEDLPPQERRIISILQTANVPILQVVGQEADDVIATLVSRFGGPELQAYIVSRDKDLDQVLRPGVVLYDPLKDEEITAEQLGEVKGWTPEQAVEAQILIGDTVDNVPGVPGVGPKTAAKLLKKYGTLAALMEHVEEQTPALRQALKTAAARFDVVRRLVTLRRDVPLAFDLERAACARFTWPRLRPVFEELGFRRLVEQLPRGDAPCEAPREAPPEGPAAGPGALGVTGADDHTGIATAVAVVAADGTTAPKTRGTGGPGLLFPEMTPEPARAPAALEPGAGRILSPEAAALAEPDGGEYRLVNTRAALEALAAELAQMPEFALDTETTGQKPMDCALVGISLAWAVGRAVYVPVAGVEGDVLPLEEVRRALAPLFADRAKRKIGQNFKYDLNVLRNTGMPVAGPLFDTMVASFVLAPTRGSHGLDSLAYHLLGHTMTPITDLIGKGRDQRRMDQVPIARVAEYSGEDVDYTWRLSRLFGPQLAPQGLDRLFHEVEMPLVRVLAELEHHGVRIDVDFLRKMGRDMAARIADLTDEIHQLAGQEFNVDSPKQLAEILFDKLCFPVIRKTKTTRSTDADTLEALQRQTQHPICARLLEHRELQKLRGTYVDALPEEISRRTGRVHTCYHQTGAVTGRLSSSEPNLQNIPIRTELGREIRRAFVPRTPEDVLVVADYSQIELRVLAHFSADEALRRAFLDDRDIHAFVAAEVNGVPLAAVTKEMRSRAKAVNFGIVYGQTAFGLAQQTGMSRGEAQAFIDAYFARYPRIRGFIDATIEQARQAGYVRTVLGRRRPIEGLGSRNNTLRAQAERFAVNTVIQGSAADLIKLAMLRLHERIAGEGLPLRMLLQVHDELVCEAARPAAAEMAGVMRSVMSSAMALSVPLKVDVATGENWLEAK